jgi:hypothetical protein
MGGLPYSAIEIAERSSLQNRLLVAHGPRPSWDWSKTSFEQLKDPLARAFGTHRYLLGTHADSRLELQVAGFGRLWPEISALLRLSKSASASRATLLSKLDAPLRFLPEWASPGSTTGELRIPVQPLSR